ncbi:hypothetical protein [Candidatus Formimonas warabiya]|uniref:Uncharacterized protein n=1 Tax=Formimonas warabiya TaxID=1761012 RepID=A0A3G1KSV2_FORW1|nr:hypothetical protein [Candidatus Formimonas warabiya]ATW25506.1 hypothetical protein DCMF_12645 [Candidatus Formimonas warabiya]
MYEITYKMYLNHIPVLLDDSYLGHVKVEESTLKENLKSRFGLLESQFSSLTPANLAHFYLFTLYRADQSSESISFEILEVKRIPSEPVRPE